MISLPVLRALAMMLLAGLPVAHAAAAQDLQRLALVVGNGRYEQVEALPGAPAAAQRMTKALKALGFDVIEITDGSNGRISAGLQTFAERARPGAVTIVYYAGHVVEFEGRNFLLPVTARVAQGFEILREGIIVGAVRGVIERARPSVGLLVLDASRESGVAAAVDTLEPSPGDLGQGGDGFVIVSAAGPDEVLALGEPFALADALAGALERPQVELGTLLAELPSGVNERSSAQRPWISGQTKGPVWLRGEPPAPPALPLMSPADQAPEAAPVEASAHEGDAAPLGTEAVASPEAVSEAVEPPEAQDAVPSAPETASSRPPTVADAGEDLENMLTQRQRRTIQSRLRTLGLYDRRVDGVFGEGTRQAVRAYQKELGEPETGRLNAGQIARLLAGPDRKMPESHDTAR